jgi:hypothetical protein
MLESVRIPNPLNHVVNCSCIRLNDTIVLMVIIPHKVENTIPEEIY